jgi:hypothetical protein
MFKIDTYDPIYQPKPVGENIWIVDGPVIGFDYLGLKLPFPTRMTIVRLSDGQLWVHSPIKLTPELQDRVNALGTVRYLIAPNTIHYAAMPEWQQTYPDAQSFGAPGVIKRAEGADITLNLTGELADAPEPGWAGEIDQVMVIGGYLCEGVFFHRASKTLILTDLIENFEAGKLHNRFWRFLNRIFGSLDPHGSAPRDMRATFIGHKDSLKRAVDQMIAWQPDRVIISHGRWYDTNATEELKRAFAWV